MIRSLIYSISFHTIIILLTILSLPFMLRQPIDLPPIISVEFIQISDKTNIPYAPKARKVIEKVKEEEKRVVSEQAPPSAKAKEKPDRIPLPDEKKEEKQLIKKKQNPEDVKPKIRQSSEFEKKEIIDTNQIAALIDKAKEEEAITEKNSSKLTQSSVKNSFATGLSLSQEDALRAQIFGCWSIPLGLPFDDNLLVRIKLKLKKDGTIMKSEILDHEFSAHTKVSASPGCDFGFSTRFFLGPLSKLFGGLPLSLMSVLVLMKSTEVFVDFYFCIRITRGHFDTQLTSLLVVNTSEFDERTSLSRIFFDNLNWMLGLHKAFRGGKSS